MFTVLLAWCIACYSGYRYAWDREDHSNLFKAFIMLGPAIAILSFSGGLWTTLLFRQISSAIWFCILVPAGLHVIISACGGPQALALGCLGVYAVAAFLWSQ